jgi:hypothetical protein
MATTVMRGARSSKWARWARTMLERRGAAKERTTVFDTGDESLRFWSASVDPLVPLWVQKNGDETIGRRE